MKRIPTDREILEIIYERYFTTFISFSKEDKERSAKIYVPIKIQEIANYLHTDGDIIFGRLYYYLDGKYGYSQDGGTRVSFFSLAVGTDRHCVNFPLLASVLASLQMEHSKFRTATVISLFSVAVAVAALLVTVFSSFCWRVERKQAQLNAQDGTSSYSVGNKPSLQQAFSSVRRP